MKRKRKENKRNTEMDVNEANGNSKRGEGHRKRPQPDVNERKFLYSNGYMTVIITNNTTPIKQMLPLIGVRCQSL